VLTIPHTQLLVGLAAGGVIFILMRWSALLREFISAVAAGSLANLLVDSDKPQSVTSVVDRLAAHVSDNPYFSLGLLLAAAGVATHYSLSHSRVS
jgi:hypothetical protein